MKLKVYCVYDCKGENFGQPFVFENRANAIRSFTEVCNNGDSQIAKYPADFTFFEIGEWDKLSGEMIMYDVKLNLGNAVEYKKSDVGDPTLLNDIKE